MRAACAILLLAACGGSSDPSCSNDLPGVCPSPAPSYRSDIDPLIGARCRTCHSAGGQESSLPFMTYQEIFSRRSSVLNQVYGCRMPPAGSAAPTSAERAVLLAWLVCGAPDN